MLGNNSIDMRMSARGGYRTDFGAVIFPQPKQEKELEESIAKYDKLSDELERKIKRVDDLLDKLEN